MPNLEVEVIEVKKLTQEEQQTIIKRVVSAVCEYIEKSDKCKAKEEYAKKLKEQEKKKQEERHDVVMRDTIKLPQRDTLCEILIRLKKQVLDLNSRSKKDLEKFNRIISSLPEEDEIIESLFAINSNESETDYLKNYLSPVVEHAMAGSTFLAAGQFVELLSKVDEAVTYRKRLKRKEKEVV